MPVTGLPSMRLDRLLGVVGLLVVSGFVAAEDQGQQAGLIAGEHGELVRATCTTCHGEQLITQARLTREGWLKAIRTMQAQHNLWDLGDNEPLILDYLATYYGPQPARQVRRRNLVLD